MANLPCEQMPFDDFGGNFCNVSKLRSPIWKVERYISDRFCTTFWFLVNKYSDRGGEEGVRTEIH